MKCSHEYVGAGIAFRFDGKPAENIRSALKANGFRWSPSSGYWWRPRVGQWADLYGWICRQFDPQKPDGACWQCQSPNGYFRNRGAATPVWCDACAAKIAEQEAEEHRRRIAADDFDLANNRCM